MRLNTIKGLKRLDVLSRVEESRSRELLPKNLSFLIIGIGAAVVVIAGCLLATWWATSSGWPFPKPTPTPTPTPIPVPTPTPKPPEPVDVVKKVVEAMQTLDVDAAKEYFCEEQKSTMDDALQEGLAELEDMGLDPDELLDAFSLEFADMKYEETSKDRDNAVVHVSGNMSLDFDTEKLEAFFKEAAAAAGQGVTDQELDFVVGIFETMSGQAAPLDGDVELVKEEGEWVVCSEPDFLDSSELFELPLP